MVTRKLNIMNHAVRWISGKYYSPVNLKLQQLRHNCYYQYRSYFTSENKTSMTLAEETKPYIFKNPEIEENEHPGCMVKLPYGFGPLPPQAKNKKIFYFDIDNCLYNRSTRIHDMMEVKIHKYFKDNLQLNDEEAHNLHLNYYKTYGLAIEGLVRNHEVDAMEYNAVVDDSLDLKSVLKYNKKLRELLQHIKETNDFDYFWLVTNAYKNHALRVISFLGLGDIFDGLTFCDYASYPILCKPMNDYFYKCFNLTQVDYNDQNTMSYQYFVDDSELNVKAAHKLHLGNVIHFIELDADYEKIISKPDFFEYYGKGDNTDSSKIKIIRDILDLNKAL